MSKICSALKRNGEKCSFKTKEGDYCGVHAKSVCDVTKKSQKLVLEMLEDQKEIRFYKKDGPFYCFSNYSPSPIEIDGKKFMSIEHYYQAMKFEKHEEYFNIMCCCDSPQKCKDLGNQKPSRFAGKWLVSKANPELGYVADVIEKYKDVEIRKDWDEVKEEVMEKGLKTKMEQNKEFYDALKSTKGKALIEDSPVDYFWGCGKDGRGKNRLGLLLMKLRDK